MKNDLREDVFDTVLASAFAEYMDNESKSMPSKEELDTEYPAPKGGLQRIKRDVKKNRPKSKAVICLQRVAVVFLAVVTLFTGVMAFSTEVRSAVFDTIVEWFDKFARVSFGDEPVVPTKVIENVGDFEIGYIPEGLRLVDSKSDNDSKEYTYTSTEGDFLFITIYSPNAAVHSGDNELSEYDNITINDTDGYIFYNDEERSGSVFFKKDDYTILISCLLDRPELIKIAENIK